MKIAYFCDFFYPELGGTQDSAQILGMEMARRGHEVWFYVPRYSKKDYAYSGVPAGELNLGANIRIVRLPSLPFPGGRSRLVLPVFGILKILKSKLDVLHVQSFWGAGLTAVLASRLFKIPLIGTNHLSVRHYPAIAGFYYRYTTWFYNRCDFVTAPSGWSVSEMTSRGLKKPSRAISNPIDTVTFSPSGEKTREESKKKFHLSPNTIAFAGKISFEKKIEFIVMALPEVKKNLPDVQLAVAGEGVFRKELEKLAKKLNVKENLNFVGVLSKSDLADFFCGSEIFAIMSTAETQGMVALQAMSCGIPVVASRSGALPEYIEGRGLLVDPGDYETLAKEIIFLLKNPKEREKLSQIGKKYAEQFSIPKIADKWEEIYGQFVSRSSRNFCYQKTRRLLFF